MGWPATLQVVVMAIGMFAVAYGWLLIEGRRVDRKIAQLKASEAKRQSR